MLSIQKNDPQIIENYCFSKLHERDVKEPQVVTV